MGVLDVRIGMLRLVFAPRAQACILTISQILLCRYSYLTKEKRQEVSFYFLSCADIMKQPSINLKAGFVSQS